MITIKEIFIRYDATPIFKKSLTATVSQFKQARLADLTLKFEDEIVHEPSFAEFQFDQDSREFKPLIELVHWNNLLLVMGLQKWLIFDTQPLGLLGSIDLHRKLSDDPGFCRVVFHTCNDLLLAIYEGGVAALSVEGQVLRHQRKYWDDELLGVDDEQLEFSNEFGGSFAFRCKDGERIEIKTAE